jgi:hypothetical protein
MFVLLSLVSVDGDRSELSVIMHDRISARASAWILGPAVAEAAFDLAESFCKSAFGVFGSGKRL